MKMKLIKYPLLMLLCVPLFGFAMDKPASLPNEDDILWVSPEMKAFVSDKKYDRKGRETRMNTLLQDIVSSEGLHFKYDANITLTASEAFVQKRGNCLTFAYLYTALARELRLDARFNRVDVPPKYSSHGKLVVETKHINVLIRIGADYYAVDLLPFYRDILVCDTDIIDDQKAFSSYYSNLGVDALSREDMETAGRLFERAYSLNDEYIGNLRNLGLFCRINKDYSKSEKYLKAALNLNERDSMVYYLLSELYKDMGDFKQSEYCLDMAHKYRKSNPFYYYANALEDIALNDWYSAEYNLQKAVSLYDRCHYLYYDLALVYERLGKIEETEKALQMAIVCASTDDLEQRYRDVMKALKQRYHNSQPFDSGYTIAMR